MERTEKINEFQGKIEHAREFLRGISETLEGLKIVSEDPEVQKTVDKLGLLKKEMVDTIEILLGRLKKIKGK